MKKIAIIILFISIYGVFFAQATEETNQLTETREEEESKIILPDVKLTIEDESEMPLQDQEDISLEDEKLKVSRVNLEELTASEVHSEIKSEFEDEDVASGKFSLSNFKIYYGLYEHLNIDINLGKSLGNVNYLITYNRNKRKNIGYGTNIFYNTELEEDDLYLDFLYTVGDKLDMSTSIGFFDKRLNLHTNSVYEAENMIHLPLNIKFTYNKNVNSMFLGNLYYNMLLLDHKLENNYIRTTLGELGVQFQYQGDWSKNNSLEVNLNYNFKHFDTNLIHDVELSALDKLPIIEALSLELGGALFVSTLKTFWGYAHGFVVYKYGNKFNAKLGVTGERDIFDIDHFLDESQIQFALEVPEQRWIYQLQLNWSPVKIMSIRSDTKYNTYGSYLTYEYDTVNELYKPVSETNIDILDTSLSLEFLIGDNVSMVLKYEYKYTQNTNLLLFSPHEGTFIFNYNNDDIGFVFNTSATYLHSRFITPTVFVDPSIIWDAMLSKSLSEDIYLELKVNNILNQDHLERLHVPTGGISFDTGIKLLI